MATFARA